MEAILSLLSTYELFNNIFPRIIFSYFLGLQNYNIIPTEPLTTDTLRVLESQGS